MAEEKEKQVKQVQLQMLPEVKPFFSDNIFVLTAFHEYGKNKERDATINLTFTNQNVAVSNVRISTEHAKALVELLEEKINEAENFKKTGKQPEQKATKTSDELSYIG